MVGLVTQPGVFSALPYLFNPLDPQEATRRLTGTFSGAFRESELDAGIGTV
jgi:hypothetical protein